MASAPATTTVTLHKGVTVTGQQRRDYQMRSSQSEVQISHDYLQQNFAGSLMQTLEGIPGVKAMSIGSGQSKPTIRGLGFNRMAVSEDGIKHEGQQWGDDHGLEIDQFAVDRAEVIKGPAALLYGSDAIGGVLSLYTNHVPTEPFRRQRAAVRPLEQRAAGSVGKNRRAQRAVVLPRQRHADRLCRLQGADGQHPVLLLLDKLKDRGCATPPAASATAA